jgi:hypothetical protein
VFLFSPKTIGTALGAEDLDVQTPGLWIMASSAGVFCALAILVCWLVCPPTGLPGSGLRRSSLRESAGPDSGLDGGPAGSAT